LNAEYAIPLFPVEDIPLILDTVLRYACLLKKASETEREDTLSNHLYKMLRKDKIFRTAPFSPCREYPLFGEEAKEGQSGRIDINFISLPGDETYFAIEAKRLHVTFPSGWQSLVGEYVTGRQGMMCFVTGKYAPFQQAAAMLGYVFDGQVDKARDGIAAAVRKGAGTLRLVVQFVEKVQLLKF